MAAGSNVVNATRANYAALQHRPGPDRYRLDARMALASGERLNWVFWIKLPDNGERWRKAATTRARNRLLAMFPAWLDGKCECEVRLAKTAGREGGPLVAAGLTLSKQTEKFL